MNIYFCCSHKVNKLVEIKNDPSGLLPNVNKGKQVCGIRISDLKFPNINIYCCCLQLSNQIW